MIPYFAIRVLRIGPINLQVWGLAVSLGIIIALVIAQRHLKNRGQDTTHLTSLAFWIIVGSFLGARIFHILFYEPNFFFANPFEIFKIWHGGLSSFGGFIGGTIAAILYLRKKKLEFVPYAHAIIQSIPLGWAIGRIGCFLIHDHPGTLSHSILAVKYPNGSRYDLGGIEILNALGMGVVMMLAKRFGAKDKVISSLGLAWYGAVRFFTDFLRATDLSGSDARYFGLTPAQYGSFILVLLAGFLIYKKKYETA